MDNEIELAKISRKQMNIKSKILKKKTIRSKINIIELSFDQISNIKVCSS